MWESNILVSLAHSYVCDERRGFAQGLIDLGNNPRAKVALECVFSFHCAGLAWHNLFVLLSMFVCNGDVTFYVCLSLCVFVCVWLCVCVCRREIGTSGQFERGWGRVCILSCC